MHPNILAVCSTEAEAAVRKCPENASIEDRLRAAFVATRGHWLCTEENGQFLAGLGAVMLFYGEGTEEHSQLQCDVDLLAAFQKGDFDAISAMSAFDVRPVGAAGIWRETKGVQR